MGSRPGGRLTDAILMIGAGGHAKVCIELLRAGGSQVDYCIGSPGGADSCLGVPVLHGDDHLMKLRDRGYELAFVAIGDNALRQRLADAARGQGFDLANAVSPDATVSPSAMLGSGIAIMAGAVINADTVIGDLAIINTLASVDHDGHIGTAAHIAPHVALAGNVTVGDRAFLGVGCVVIPGITVGSDAIAGAGSAIISDVASGSRVVGVPATAKRTGSLS